MAIKLYDQGTPSLGRIAVNDPLTQSRLELGRATERLGGTLANLGFKGLENIRMKEATDMANQVVLRDEHGNIRKPKLPESGGMFGPTMVEQQYQKQLLDNYRNAVLQDGSEYFNRLHSEFRHQPAEFNAAAEAYIGRIIENTPGVWSRQIQDSLENIRIQHGNQISTERADRDFKEASSRHVFMQEQRANDLAKQLMLNKDRWESPAVQEALTEYNEMMYEGISNQYYGGTGAQLYFMKDQQMLAKAMVAGMIKEKGDGYYAQDDRLAVIDEFMSGDMVLPLPEYDDAGNMNIVERKVSSFFGDKELLELGRAMKSSENMHQQYLETHASLTVEKIQNAFNDGLNLILIDTMALEPGQQVDTGQVNALMDDMKDMLFELYNEDPVRRDQMISRIVDYAQRRAFTTIRQLRQENEWNEKLANWEQVDGHLMIRIEQLIQELGVENFGRYTGEEDLNSWLNDLPSQHPQRLHNNISNTYRQLSYWNQSAGSSNKYDEINAKWLGWFEKAKKHIADFNRANGIDENMITEAGIRHASRFVSMPNIKADKKGSEYVEARFQQMFHNQFSREYDWSNLEEDTDPGRYFLNTYSAFAVPPRGMLDFMVGALSGEGLDAPAQVSRGLMWFEEMRKNPAMFKNLDNENMLGNRVYNAYTVLSNSGGDLANEDVRKRVQGILAGDAKLPFEQLSRDEQSALRKEIDSVMNESTEWFDSDIKPPPELRSRVRYFSSLRTSEFPDNPEKAVEKGYEDALQAGGWSKTYTGYNHTAKAEQLKTGGENIYIYAQRAPDWYVEQGVVDTAFVNGDRLDRLGTALDYDINTPLHQKFNKWANDNIDLTMIDGPIVLGKNAYLDHYEDDQDTGMPVYRVVLRSKAGNFVPARGSSRYDFTRNLPHPLFDFNEHYLPWYQSNYKDLAKQAEKANAVDPFLRNRSVFDID